MKRLIWLLLLLAVAVGLYLLSLAIEADRGYVLFAYKGFRYQSGLWAFLGLLLAVVLVYYLGKWLLRLLLSSTRLANPWSRLHRNRRVRLASEQGMLDLAEGRWARAQRQLTRAAEADSQPLMFYLGAARAANKLGQHEQSDALLEQALNRQPQAELAIALTHAELQRSRGDMDAALDTLQAMHERHPGHHLVLRQLQRLYLQRQDWSALLGLLPELRKEKALPAAELDELERETWRGRLGEAGLAGQGQGETALQPLTQAWQQLSAPLRQEPELIAAYVEQLRRLGAQEEAEEVLRSALKRGYDSRLARFYGVLRGADPARQLQTAELWLKQHPQDPALLLTLGRLCLQNQLWGKARDYFESSLKLERHPETCAELARLLAQLGELERSNQLLLESLGLLHQGLPPLPQPQGANA
ncbi:MULTISPECIES: heme biosynthesis HemY N-terminal domain-containing protein [Pseudomonas]|jgi:HemY protein|uniref:HemY protein n=2 Tax=Ectopseudomonas TaxID=3236654 RepID=A0A653B5B1_ECTOL|nr:MULTISPECIES: heme biosynthesis HemY N-terminal domain-containing protein [Pseudomonas]CAE6885156.1 Homolog of E. coli HemY protein [Pseudomonas oleovorans]QFT20229.1 putative protoheme IX biogenesis protein [Pseudomonas sp. THAF187a]QFT40420.1 putative protoheme IX biogenesis protein [Pseudomonas sp. THAF42]QTS86835.1 heme biosynthesis protein HemY [Pseudomonas khazarica]WFC60627.1 heme biosynthesis protein HemY [Pseudomonas sp. REST10]|tara:strand:- start:24621 stop:25868 length:1248 start_codon:yes stop_codon:yes gene_type:complete